MMDLRHCSRPSVMLGLDPGSHSSTVPRRMSGSSPGVTGCNQPEDHPMARVPYLEPTDLAPADQDLLKRPITMFKALVHSPNAARAFNGLSDYIRYGSKLDMRLRELAILQVGWLARSPYEWSHHVKLGLDFGVTEADIQALIDDNAGKPTTLDALTRQVLQAAREITTDGEMSDTSFA